MSGENGEGDKRGAPRRSVHLVAEIEVEGQWVGSGVSRDASATGLLLLTELPIARGSEVKLKLYVPREDEPRPLLGKVVRCVKMPLDDDSIWSYQVGVALDDPPSDLREILEAYVKR